MPMLAYLLQKTGLAKAKESEETTKQSDTPTTPEHTQDESAEPSTSTTTNTPSTTTSETSKPVGKRVSGRTWKVAKTPLRVNTVGKTKWEKRREADMQLKALKQQEKDMKDEARQKRDDKLNTIKERRAAKEEKERYEKLAQKYHAKKVARMRKREKRNKLLNER